MKALQTKHIEDCFDGSNIYELIFDSPISKQLVYRLGQNGTVQYFDQFIKPFYKVRVPGIYDLKGIAGNDSIRVHLKSSDGDALDKFLSLIAIEAAQVADSDTDLGAHTDADAA